jgi:hypothetical protein
MARQLVLLSHSNQSRFRRTFMAEIKSTRRGGKIKDITGKTFGKMTVVAFAYVLPKLGAYWLCRCECGNEKVARGPALRKGSIVSCGCHKARLFKDRSTTHGLSHLPVFRRWCGMIQRCSDPNHIGYHNYGAKGIAVCDRWLSFENFYADMGEPATKIHSIERRNGSLGYSPENCYWATQSQQARNTSQNHNITFRGKTQCLIAWAEEVGITRGALTSRLNRGWSVERALSTPVKR